MGFFSKLRDIVGPKIGIGESRETREEREYAEKQIQLYEKMANAADWDTKIAVATVEGHRLNVSRDALNQDIDVKLGYSSLKPDESASWNEQVSLKEGSLAKMGSPAVAFGYADTLRSTANSSLENYQVMLARAQGFLDKHGATLEDAANGNVSTHFQESAKQLEKDAQAAIKEADNTILNPAMKEQMSKAYLQCLSYPEMRERYEAAHAQIRAAEKTLFAVEDGVDGTVGGLQKQHDMIANDLKIAAADVAYAQEQVEAWQSEAQRIELAMANEISVQPGVLPDSLIGMASPGVAPHEAGGPLYPTSPEGFNDYGGPKDMPVSEPPNDANGPLYPDSPDGFKDYDGPKNMPSM